MTAFIVIIFVFFAIVSLLFLLGWHSHRDSTFLGGIVLMVIAIAILIIILILAGNRFRRDNQPSALLPFQLQEFFSAS
jgi:uncharacterized membrane protein